MIKVNLGAAGLTLFEVLIAVLLFSVVMVGSARFQTTLLGQLSQAKQQNLAQSLAFQLLEVYPDVSLIHLPQGWQYQLTTSSYHLQCKIIKVTIQPNLGNEVT